ncbi:MAG: DMT family transporter [Dorea sp.]|nr:DMT family transporter [Dorea sp.]MDE6938696.1 DMT family transporter [Lachnospiraceae bacterium]
MKTKNVILLVLTAFIWGTAFVAQSVGMDYLEPFTFNGVRSLIGGIALLPCIWFLGRMNGKAVSADEDGRMEEGKLSPAGRKELLLGGIACGLLLFCATSLQQIGIQYTTAGKAGFITAFYIVIVPVLGIFLGKRIGWKVWLAVAAALAGLYFLCITDKFTVGKGDVLIFVCAVVFSVHILVIDHFSPRVDGVKMSCIQFLVCGIMSLPFMFALETPKAGAMLEGWMPLLYAGVLSCGVAYTLQIIGQKNVNPAVASLILSLESCFSVLAGWAVLGERLSVRETAGCVLMFTAIILAQMPDGRENGKEKDR